MMMEDTVGEMIEEHTVGVRRTQLQNGGGQSWS